MPENVCAVWSDNGFQKDNSTFAGLQFFKHILFNSCFLIETWNWTTLFSAYGISICTASSIYAYRAEASQNENMSVQPYQKDCLPIILESVSAVVFRRNSIMS